MHADRSVRLPGFESRWLAEALRLREQAAGPLDDRDACAAARAAGGTLEQRIVRRAWQLGERDGIAGTIARWRSRSRLALALASAVALASGFAAAIAVLGDGARPVNVVWALGALLGLHLLSLMLWCAGAWLGRGHAGGALGRVWMRVASRLPSGPAALQVAQALAGLLSRSRLLPWWLGAVTHGLWLGAMGGALAGLLVTLSARRYGFVWETTILPPDAFVQFVHDVGWLPAKFGFTMPDAAMVSRSGTEAVADETTRRAWSSWLVGSVVAYGVTPRLLLWALCFGVWRVGRARLRLDPALPGYPLLAARLAPGSERIGIVDADPGASAGSRFAAYSAVGGAGAVALGLELRGPSRWPPSLPEGVVDAGIVDNRDERRRVLAMLRSAPPARLLVVCDAGQTPDRGSLELIAALSQHAGDCRVLLRADPRTANRDRLPHWRDGLQGIGMTNERIMDSDELAYRWLSESRTEEGRA